KLVRFPEMRANKIGVDLSLLVAKSDLKARDLGEEKFYNVDVIGEVVKGERLIDNFKYRFDIPTQEIGGEKIPLTVRRYLYPGDYNLVLKISDGNQSAEGRITDKLTVPEQPDAPPPEVAAAVNEGREIFRVRVMSPEKGSKVSGPTKVVAAVAVPEGKTLQKLEIYSNERRVATLYQPPFEQTVNIQQGKSLGYIRIVGTLEDGTGAEDLRCVNAPAYISEVSVDAVELYTTVTDKGRPVSGLQQSNFKVLEDGVIQKVESFEYVKNLPLTLGVMVDTSASMLESLPEAQQAALTFLDYSIGPKDRAF